MSGLINKAKAAVSGNKSSNDPHVDNPQSSNTGPHKSELLNKLDPRVDSDRDHRNDPTSQVGGRGDTQTGYGNTQTSGYGDTQSSGYGNQPHHAPTGAHGPGSAVGGGYGSTNAGPHDSNLLNKADPRVDSDRDGSRGYGNQPHHAPAGAHAPGSAVGGGYGSSTTTAGPHDSNLANKLDPRVDSDRDGSNRLGGTGGGQSHQASYGTHGAGAGTGGYGSSTTTAGPHDSNLANKLDPRVDSDRDGSNRLGGAGGQQHQASYGTHGAGTTGGGYGTSTTHGSGQTTAGPYSSNLANKLDPRVDSDRDGSGTIGGGNNTRY